MAAVLEIVAGEAERSGAEQLGYLVGTLAFPVMVFLAIRSFRRGRADKASPRLYDEDEPS